MVVGQFDPCARWMIEGSVIHNGVPHFLNRLAAIFRDADFQEFIPLAIPPLVREGLRQPIRNSLKEVMPIGKVALKRLHDIRANFVDIVKSY